MNSKIELVLRRARWSVLALAIAALTAGCKSGGSSKEASAGSTGLSSPTTVASSDLSDTTRKNVESFDQVWTTIRDRHWDANVNGVDWEAVRTELRPKVQGTKSVEQGRAVIQEALSRLNQSHFAVIPASAYAAAGVNGESAETKPAPEDRGDVGLTLRAVDGQVLVTAVREGSPAAAAGVQSGWVLERNGKRKTADVLSTVGKAFKEEQQRQMAQSQVAGLAGTGKIGEELKLRFRDEKNKKRTVALVAKSPPGEKATFGNLPPLPVVTESRTLPSGVGYAHLSIFLNPPRVANWYELFIRGHMTAPGLIIDLRGNPGGIGAMAMGMGGWLINQNNLALGTMITRDSKLRFVMNKRPRNYTGPVAILVDELSMSTSEIFAGGLQDLGRVRVFGTPTPGAALPSTIEILPNGDRFQYAFANYISASGKTLEGHGVVPDEVVVLSRDAFKDSRDPALEAAERWILSGGQMPATMPAIAPATQPSAAVGLRESGYTAAVR